MHHLQPIPGYAVCNIGDALAILSGGILRSNMHRVMYVICNSNDYLSNLYVYIVRPLESKRN